MPQDQAPAPGLPKNFKILPEGGFTKFEGLNTKDPRSGIGEQEASWQENFIRFGNSIRSIPDNGASIYTASGGRTIIMHFPFNIGETQYIAVFLSNGTADQVKISDHSVVPISSVANTFYNPANPVPTLPACAQWGSSGLLIVGTSTANDYYAWDEAAGGTLYGPGAMAPLWLSGLAALLTPNGDTHTSTSITNMTTTTGIVVGMTITGSGIPANTTVTVIVSGTAITISQATSSSLVGTPLTIGWAIPLTGVSGDSIETFQSRVWIGNSSGGLITFSAPSNGAVFATSQGGGTFTSTDSFLKVGFHAIKQANGYLYPYGDSSIQVISNVQTTGSPPTTTFNNSNADPQVGTPWRDSLTAYGKALLFGAGTGLYGMYGSTAEKLTDKFDGIFATATLPTTGIAQPNAAVATIYSLKVYLLLLNIEDPFTGQNRNAMIGWDGKTAFVASQTKTLTYISTQMVNSTPTAWGTDGTTLFPLFQNAASTTLTKTLQTKLWAGDGFIVWKQGLRLYTQAEDNSGSGYSFGGTIDEIVDSGSGSVAIAQAGGSTFSWVNSSNGVFTWVNASAGTFTWGNPGIALQGGDMTAYGLLLGATLTSTSPDFTLINLALGVRSPYSTKA